MATYESTLSQSSSEVLKRDTSTWTQGWLTAQLTSSGGYSPIVVKELFGWTHQQWLNNMPTVMQELDKHGVRYDNKLERFGHRRTLCETALRTDYEDRFKLPHEKNNQPLPHYLLQSHIDSGQQQQQQSHSRKPASVYQYLINTVVVSWKYKNSGTEKSKESEVQNDQSRQPKQGDDASIQTDGSRDDDNDAAESSPPSTSDQLPQTEGLPDLVRHRNSLAAYSTALLNPLASTHHAAPSIVNNVTGLSRYHVSHAPDVLKDDIVLRVGKITRAGNQYSIRIKLCYLPTLLDNTGDFVWSRVDHVLELTADGRRLYFFPHDEVWPIDDAIDFLGSIQNLRLNMDAHLRQRAVSIFTARNMGDVARIPARYRRLELQTSHMIRFDLLEEAVPSQSTEEAE